ncbi:MAG: peptidoglycan-binding domain-containing protein [Chthoniobacterales bacterium]
MRRYFVLGLLLIGSLSVFAAADANIRAAQTKLKEGGFYFGEVDGAVSSDLSAAITRYQIRNGLQITGNLNAETSKALGVKTEVAESNSAVAPASDTWRRLRKTDQQFLTRRGTHGSAPSPIAQKTDVAPSADSPTAALEPAGPGSSKLVLSPERLRDYVAAFVLAGLDPQVGAELEFFGDHVRYYNEGVAGREKIRADLKRYDAQWPQRRFWLAGDLDVTPQPDSRLRVTFPLRYELRNGTKHASGKIRKMLLLEVTGEDLQIVGVDEKKT